MRAIVSKVDAVAKLLHTIIMMHDSTKASYPGVGIEGISCIENLS